ncbi:MAG TPA: hypothetical protein VFO52_10490 [Longimicrobiales bacterium]|nr:hypothetical protein [Longimicrobiales bacterium]
MQVRSFVAWAAAQVTPEPAPIGQHNTSDGLVHHARGRIQVSYVARADGHQSSPDDLLELCLGDSGDLDRTNFLENAASAVPIRYDAARGQLSLATSIVGMPPVFLYRDAAVTAVTSDIHLLLRVPGVQLEMHPHSVIELARIGHPVEHRTLFRNLSIVESGARLVMEGDGSVQVTRSWQMPDTAPLDWPQFLDAQMSAFTGAVKSIDVERTFLSLTAGLDTRTVFAALAAQQRLMPGATMSAAGQLSLDAMTARRLCNAYGVEHFVVTFGDDFRARLPQHIEDASLLSGGLATLDQAPEVYLYRHLGARFGARLSGNLGNQVGRGGTEGVSTRSANVGILSDRFTAARQAQADNDSHWLLSRLDDSQRGRLQFILQNEIVFTLVGNFTIGNHFATQKTPYANRQLIETLALRPVDQVGSPSSSKLRMRLRDLSHRFFGEPENRSFQRALVRRIDGFAAECPVNWGWRPSGGISPAAFARGVATLAGMYARAQGLDGKSIPGAAALGRLAKLHDFRDARRWLRVDLRDYIHDILLADDVRAADLFDQAVLQETLKGHFERGVDHHTTIVFALDVALAHRTFSARAQA